MSYDLRSALGWITVIGVVSSIFAYILSLFTTVLALTTTQLGAQLQTITQPAILWAFFLGAEVNANVFLVVALSLVVYVVCFVKAARANGSLLPSIRALTSGAPPRTLPNWLSVMPLLASSLLLIELLLSFLQDLFGVSTGMLGTTDPTALVPGLALAPLAEEIGFRISVLGLVVGILVAWRMGKTIAGGTKFLLSSQLGRFFVAFVSPGYAKERVGLPSIRTSGWKGISTSEWIFLAITSAVFGLYHIIGGGGWGPGKFLTAALSGFALGIVYLAYGAFADILLHWFFDLNLYIFTVPGLNGFFGLFGDLATLGALGLGVWGIIVGIYWLTTRRPSPVRPLQTQFV